MKKAILAILALLLLTGSFCSCSDPKKKGETNSGQSNTGTGGNEASREGLDPKYVAELPDINFEGREITIVKSDFAWSPSNLDPESEIGELVNDAAYQRNRNIEERYGLEINVVTMNNAETVLPIEIAAGNTQYNAAFLRMDSVIGGIEQNAYADLFAVPNINMDKHYWDQSAKEQFTIGHKLYFMISDITIQDKLLTSAMLYNKKLIADYSLGDLYKLVFDGKWTIDVFNGMIKGLSKSLDGSAFNEKDFYGHATQNENYYTFFYGAGERFIGKDDNDMPYMLPLSPNMDTVASKINEIFNMNDSTLNWHRYLEHGGVHVNAFREDRAVFFTGGIAGYVALRDMESDFGVLPMPKFNEAQEYYITDVNPISPAVLIPSNLSEDDLFFTGLVLEAMAAESRRLLIPAFFEQTLDIKYARDDETSQVLDMVFAHRAFDLMYIYNFGNFSGTFFQGLVTGNLNVASFYEKNFDKTESMLNKFIAAFEQ